MNPRTSGFQKAILRSPLLLLAALFSWLLVSCTSAGTGANSRPKCTIDSFRPTAKSHPFSFVYRNAPSSGFLAGWTYISSSRTIDTNRTEHTFCYTDPATRLEVRCIVTEYKNFPALEWVFYFKNNGSEDTPILQDILPLDLTLISASAGQPVLYYADGSHVLVSDFQPRQTNLTSTVTTLVSLGGRSSDGTLPFFNLSQPGGTGATIGVGWTGQWAARFITVGDKGVNIQAGMETNHFKLTPGEEVRTPAVLLQFWSGGDRVKAQHDLKRLLAAYYTPTVGGLPVATPVCASPYGAMALEATTEAKMIEGINNLSSNNIPVDVWWVDAAWYPCDGSWVKTGTWEPDPVRYPRGLKPVADAAHGKGMKFLLWFEPERAMEGTWLFQHHPEWLIGPVAGSGLLNLGNPQALAWAERTFDGIINDVGIDIYRQDLNGNDPMVYWKTLDTPDRLGITEIKYITGLYDYVDYLRAQNPNLIIDICSSGGRRLDFEMLRRATAMTRSDYTEPIGMQCQTYGLSQWIPLTGYGTTSVDAYSFRSGLGNFTTVSLDWYNNPGIWEPARRMLGQYKSVQHLFSGDFYPLSSYSTATNAWIAWQYNRSDIGKGLVQVFRRPGSLIDSETYKLHGLLASGHYRVTDLDQDVGSTNYGIMLMQDGLTVEIKTKPGSALIRYERVD
jgi:alpha-galactosidase